jgi:DNA polymerase-3 subunit gamma/tau
LEALERHRDQFSPGDLLRMLSMLSGIETQFRRSSQQQLLVEMLLVRFALLDRSISLEEVLQGLAEGGGSQGARSVSSPERSAVRSRPGQTSARAAEPAQPERVVASSYEPPRPTADRPSVADASPVPPSGGAGPGKPDAMPGDQPDWKSEFDQTASSRDRSRLTTEAVREERLARMRAHDPVLDAAIRELDLDLLD